MTSRCLTHSVVRHRALAILAYSSACSALGAQDAPPPIPTPDFEGMPAHQVVRVIDARSVGLLIDDEERRVILCGVSAPARESDRERLRAFLENLLNAEAVFVRYDSLSSGESDGPRRAYLFRAPDGLFVNLEVIRQGYAKVGAKPACEHQKLLRHYERRAKQARKGVWTPRLRTERVSKSRAAASQPTARTDEITVYVTKSGKKYHRKDCYHLRKSSRAISLKEAARKGYGACSHCKPPTSAKP